MRAWASAMIQDFAVGAACFFEGIGQHRKALEGPGIVNLLCQANNWLGEPASMHGERTEGIAENLPHQFRELFAFGFSGLGSYFSIARVRQFRKSLLICEEVREMQSAADCLNSSLLGIFFEDSEFRTIQRPCSRNS